MKTYKAVYLFAGIGGGAKGFQEARREYRGLEGSFETLCGIDCDPEACADFEYITGARAVLMDLFNREQYRAWHGKEPREDWREVTAADLASAAGDVPDVVFTSPPCKGFSALLPAKSANTEKYQALNGLTIRGIRLVAEAWAPSLILMENVPRILSRGKEFLEEIKATLAAFGYVFNESTHDCGELGGLGQKRQRYLLIARNPAKLPAFVYQPMKYPLKSIGDIIGPLPMPGHAGRMHELPNLQFRTWMRLALIPAGGDWRDLESSGWEDLRIEHMPRNGTMGVQAWEEPASTVTGNCRPAGSSPAAVADPRVGDPSCTHNNVYRITRWEDPALAVTGAGKPNSGSVCVADPRPGYSPGRHGVNFRVTPWEEAAGTVTTATQPSEGSLSIADPRLSDRQERYSHKYQVSEWEEPSKTIIGQTDIQCGAPSIADPRLGERAGRYANQFRVEAWDKPSDTVTGQTDLQNSGLSVADPRVAFKSTMGTMGVMDWEKPAGAVTGMSRASSGSTPASIADPRLKCEQRSGTFGVMDWREPAPTVSGNLDVHAGAAAVADVRIPAQTEAGQFVIISLDGTWHRPLTTLELAALQGFPIEINGQPLQLAGNSDQRWRERIGNAVPVGAARGIACAMLDALLANEYHEIMYCSITELWVKILLAVAGYFKIKREGK